MDNTSFAVVRYVIKVVSLLGKKHLELSGLKKIKCCGHGCQIGLSARQFLFLFMSGTDT